MCACGMQHMYQNHEKVDTVVLEDELYDRETGKRLVLIGEVRKGSQMLVMGYEDFHLEYTDTGYVVPFADHKKKLKN